jgi:hypothetical protein
MSVGNLRLQTTPVVRGANLTAGQKYVLCIPRALYILGINMTFRGRSTVTVPLTTLLPEGLLNLVQRVQLQFTHDIYGTDTPLDVSGPALFTYKEIYDNIASPATADVTPPLSVNVGTYDFTFYLSWQMPPEGILTGQVPFYLLDAPRCSLLQLSIQWGGPGFASYADGGTYALTAYASAAGLPSVDVDVVQVLDQTNNPLTAMVRRQCREVDLSATPFPVTRDLITIVQTGETIRSEMFRQYVRDTTAGQPTSAALTLVDPVNPGVDAGISDIGQRVNTKFIREWNSFATLQDENQKNYGMSYWPLGIGIIEYVAGLPGNIDRSLFTQDFVTRRLQLDVAGTVVTQAAGRVEILTTSIKPNPQLGRSGGSGKPKTS